MLTQYPKGLVAVVSDSCDASHCNPQPATPNLQPQPATPLQPRPATSLQPHCSPTATYAPRLPATPHASCNPTLTLPATPRSRFLQPRAPRLLHLPLALPRPRRYDIYNACNTLWGKELVEMIKNRDGRLVVRPDSGDPPVIVCEVRTR